MKKLKITGLLLALLIGLSACSSDDNPKLPKGDYENGYFITNEGPFQNGTGTLTFVSDEGEVFQNIYKTVNNEDLGNIVQSMYLKDDNAYIVVNNSNKIVVANRYTMEKLTEIAGQEITNPRYFVSKGDIGYISNWGDPLNPDDDFISVIDLKTNSIINTIAVGEGPENMLVENDKLFVNLKGGFGHNNKVTVIDLSNNQVNSIEVGYVPNSIVSDNNGNIWVLCEGKPNWTGDETSGELHTFNTGSLTSTYFVFNDTDHPKHLNFESDKLYYNLNGKVYEMAANANELPINSINGLDGFYYTMKVKDGDLYGTDAADFNSEGTLKIMNIISGNLVETYTTGIIPGSIVFQ